MQELADAEATSRDNETRGAVRDGAAVGAHPLATADEGKEY